MCIDYKMVEDFEAESCEVKIHAQKAIYVSLLNSLTYPLTEITAILLVTESFHKVN